MQKFFDWEVRLDKYIHECANKDYSWGEHDCVLFAAGCIYAMTGIDLGKPFRGKYKTKRGAIGILKRRFGGGLEILCEKMAQKHKWLEVRTTMAQRGSVVLFEDETGGTVVGIVGLSGTKAFICDSRVKKGFLIIPFFEKAKRAWLLE